MSNRIKLGLPLVFSTIIELETDGLVGRRPDGGIYPIKTPIGAVIPIVEFRCRICDSPEHNILTCPKVVDKKKAKQARLEAKEKAKAEADRLKQQKLADRLAAKQAKAEADRLKQQKLADRFVIKVDDQNPVFQKSGKYCGYCAGLCDRRSKPFCKGCKEPYAERGKEELEVYKMSNIAYSAES